MVIQCFTSVFLPKSFDHIKVLGFSFVLSAFIENWKKSRSMASTTLFSPLQSMQSCDSSHSRTLQDIRFHLGVIESKYKPSTVRPANGISSFCWHTPPLSHPFYDFDNSPHLRLVRHRNDTKMFSFHYVKRPLYIKDIRAIRETANYSILLTNANVSFLLCKCGCVSQNVADPCVLHA